MTNEILAVGSSMLCIGFVVGFVVGRITRRQKYSEMKDGGMNRPRLRKFRQRGTEDLTAAPDQGADGAGRQTQFLSYSNDVVVPESAERPAVLHQRRTEDLVAVPNRQTQFLSYSADGVASENLVSEVPTPGGPTISLGDCVFEIVPTNGAFMLLRQSGTGEAFLGSTPIRDTGVVLSEQTKEVSVKLSDGSSERALVPEEYLPLPPGQSPLNIHLTSVDELGSWQIEKADGRIAAVWIDRSLASSAVKDLAGLLREALNHVSPGPAAGLVCDQVLRVVHGTYGFGRIIIAAADEQNNISVALTRDEIELDPQPVDSVWQGTRTDVWLIEDRTQEQVATVKQLQIYVTFPRHAKIEL